jgi:hypothetical protein
MDMAPMWKNTTLAEQMSPMPSAIMPNMANA